jgi:hypothetical protein
LGGSVAAADMDIIIPNSVLKKVLIIKVFYILLNVQQESSGINAQSGTGFTLFDSYLVEIMMHYQTGIGHF